MTKRDFIALADMIREHYKRSLDVCLIGPDGRSYKAFTADQVSVLADFCQSQNPRFNRERWLNYIAGECGPNGGKTQAKGGR